MLWKLLGPGIIIILIPASNCPRVARNTEPFTPSTERLIQEFYIWDPKSASWERAPLDSSDVGSLSTTTRGAGFAQCPLRPFNFSQLPQSSGDDRSPLGWRHGKVKKITFPSSPCNYSQNQPLWSPSYRPSGLPAYCSEDFTSCL